MTRVAVADLGTNSTRLLVADVAAGGDVDEVERILRITRLGEGVDASGSLAPAARQRVLDVLDAYAATARGLGAERALAVATSAVRDAANRAAFLADVAAAGFEPRLLSGEEEAAATFRGVLTGSGGDPEGALVIDVGGGSTEMILGGPAGSVAWSRSIDAGCVRMTERYLGEERVEQRAIAACVHALRRDLAAVPEDVVEAAQRGIAVAGTATTAAALDLELPAYDAERIHGHRLARSTVLRQTFDLAAMTLAERRALPGMEEGRAPVICGGLVTLGQVMDCFELTEVVVSERDILHGAALLAADVSASTRGR